MNIRHGINEITKKIAKAFKKPNVSDNEGDEFDFIPGIQKNETDFVSSLKMMIPEDVGEAVKNKKTDKKKTPLSVRITLIALTLVICVCAVYLVYDIADQKRGSDFYDDVASGWDNMLSGDGEDGAVPRMKNLMASSPILCLADRIASGNSQTLTPTHNEKLGEMRAKLTALSVTFPDLYGWIFVENTAINYPVVQGDDNDYYLDHAPDKTSLINGTIFVDANNTESVLRNFNTVLYGHNLAGGGMFHDVTKFKDETFFENSLIYFYTMEGAYVFRPFAIYETDYRYQYFRTSFTGEADFVSFANEMKGNSMFQTDVTFSGSDRIITLSTCTNGAYSGRYSLQAKLIQVIN